jgi:hypothetical protein
MTRAPTVLLLVAIAVPALADPAPVERSLDESTRVSYGVMEVRGGDPERLLLGRVEVVERRALPGGYRLLVWRGPARAGFVAYRRLPLGPGESLLVYRTGATAAARFDERRDLLLAAAGALRRDEVSTALAAGWHD